MTTANRGLGRRFPAGPAWSSERGAVLLETAIAIPVLVMVTAALIWACSIVGASFQLADTARYAARELARGAQLERIDAEVRAQVPESVMRIDREGKLLVVTLRRRMTVPGGLLRGLGLDIEQTARVASESAGPSSW